jgi:hypothetical protein
MIGGRGRIKSLGPALIPSSIMNWLLDNIIKFAKDMRDLGVLTVEVLFGSYIRDLYRRLASLQLEVSWNKHLISVKPPLKVYTHYYNYKDCLPSVKIEKVLPAREYDLKEVLG